LVFRRQKGVISKVQNQNLCGSCFALSVIETIESMVAIKSGKLPVLSVQQMLDCNEYHMNCKGGDSCALLNWLQSTQTRLSRNDEYSSIKDDLIKCSIGDDKAFGIKVKDYSCNE
jgi:cathepsin O